MPNLLPSDLSALADALATASCDDPFRLLGPHEVEDVLVWRAWMPAAHSAELLTDADAVALPPVPGHPGLFAGEVAGYDGSRPGRLRFTSDSGTWETHDPFSLPSTLEAGDLYLFNEGTHQGVHHWLGAQPMTCAGLEGYRFAVWAPNARSASLLADANGWDARVHPMRRHAPSGVWELFLPGVEAAHHYKYALTLASGERVEKADPVGAWQQNRQQTASLTAPPLPPVPASSRRPQSTRDPVSIYEVHAGSWKRHPDGSYYSYDELADALIGYVVDLGFTHIQLMPIAEHPFDGSWGYQPTGLFAPTSRFGEPAAFRRFVSRCHDAGLGVLLDWVPAHFPEDEHGLARFDGTALYEHADPRRGYHPDWNTLIYNYARHEVRSFLVSNALMWLERYGIDGLRVDAVASMLYLDYSRGDGEWLPNVHGGRENLEAVAFLQQVNTALYGAHPQAVSVAEESTDWPGVTRAAHQGGLGFGFKWNMGWMNDTLSYMSRDPVYRSHHHGELTFGLVYAFDENFILPLSHDEVVHGKRSILGRMPGDRWQQFANLRAYYAFMWTHPGKKLLFMGAEFAQSTEWNHDTELSWHLLAHAEHRGAQQLVRDLNALYTGEAALHALDCDARGFQWLKAGDAQGSTLAYARCGEAGELMIIVCNFTPVVREGYRLGVPKRGYYRERINSDAAIYGGGNVGNAGGVWSEDTASDGQPASVSLRLAPLATQIFQWAPEA